MSMVRRRLLVTLAEVGPTAKSARGTAWRNAVVVAAGLTAALVAPDLRVVAQAPTTALPLGAPRNDLPQPYRTTRDWGQLPAGVAWAAVTAIEPAADGSIYVIQRCFENSCAGRSEAPILKYDERGTLLASWGQGMFEFPHGATTDRDSNLWVTDAPGTEGGKSGKGHQVVKFSPAGKVLMTLGQAGVSGSGPSHFDRPTDVVVSPTGTIFVADSHRNGTSNRVVKFTKDGRYVKEWGTKGSGRGQMSEPHTIAMDSRGRLFVGDRENNRILIFDQDGTPLDEWRQFGRPSGIFITADDTIYVADSESGPDTGAHELPGIKKGIRVGSAIDGSVTAFIEDMESTVADHSGAEGVGVDARGNVYGAVVRRRMLERHVKVPAGTNAAPTPMAYQQVANWAQLPPGTKWGTMTAVDIDAAGTVYALQREPSRVMVFDSTGRPLRSWGDGLFQQAHGLRVDRQGNVWVTDRGSHQVLKFSPDGKLLQEIGKKGVAGDNNATDALNGPSDLVFAPNGEFFVSDGESTNTRVVKYLPDGTFLKFWGTKGKGPGQLDVPHSIAMDSKGWIYVANRSNKRIEVFDHDGRFLDQITSAGTPYGLFMTKDDLLYVVDGTQGSPDEFLTIVDTKNSNVLGQIHGLTGPHMVSVSSGGDIYVAEVRGMSIKKFVRK